VAVLDIESGPAVFSSDRAYRYFLERVWARGKRRAVFIGLNPSTADENSLDPTLRRCADFADQWGCGGFTMLNLYAFRATDPKVMKSADNPIGPDNDAVLLVRCYAPTTRLVVACWGAHADEDRVDDVRSLLLEGEPDPVTVYCLGRNQNGSPKHPLYLPKTTELEEFWS
jgi:hypothetical protein